MGIYRGPGGSGDAVNDSSSETRLAVEARDAALAAQAAAEAAQAAAETAETNAETAETNAETAETNAETAATSAASSASAASTSASNASSSASSASTSATNAASSASSASSSASAASTSATNAATSATNAANSATAAATSETNASNSATAAASSASSASSSASTATTQASNASTSATNAASSATSAASSASTATTQAGLASTSATNAANSASAASTSATNASNSASAASTSASNAATSATNAASSATSAASSASSAQSASDAALAALDSFDDRYLGQKSSAPTVDNDGNALVTGALYFDTVSNAMKVWDGTQWLSAYASLSGALLATNNLSDLTSTSTARTNLGVAIGTDVQAYDADTAKLDVSQSWSAAQAFNAGVTLGDASGDALTINSSAVSIPNGLNFDSNTFVIDATNNRIGVGTSSPDTKLEVSSATGTASPTPTEIRISTTSNASDWSTTLPWGRLSFYSEDGSDSGPKIQGSVDFVSDSISGGRGSMVFNTAPSTGVLTERMRIDSSGNVGIGNSNPSSYNSGGYQLVIGNGSGYKGLTIAASTEGNIYFADGTTGSQAYAGTIGYNHTSDAMYFYTVGSERMRITSAGNVGIGTSSPSTILDIRGTGGAAYSPTVTATTGTNYIGWKSINTGGSFWTAIDNSTGGAFGSSIPYARNIWSDGAYPIIFSTNSTVRMNLDSSGNLGLGVTPSAWGGAGKGFEVSFAGSALFASSATNTSVLSNAYYNGTNFIYAATGAAGRAQINTGTHAWHIAPSGTAGTAITFTQAMTLDANGRLLIGNTTNNTSFGGLLQVEGTDKAFASLVRYSSNAAGAPAFYLARSKSATLGTNTIVASGDTLGTILFAGANGTTYSDAAYIQAAVDSTPGASADMPGRLMFFTSADGSATPTERMRIDSSGNVGINTGSITDPAGWGKLLQIYKADYCAFSIRNASNQWDLANYGGAFAIWNGTNERMRIDSSGNVGIGTSSPAQSLHINSSGNAYTKIQTSSASAEAGVQLTNTAGDTYIYKNAANNNLAVYQNGADMFRITSAGLLQFNSGYGSAATAYGCRAWVNFNGTGTVAIRASGNVSSITDNATGDYTVNFTTAMPDTNYATVTGMSGNANSTNGNEFYVSTQISGPSYNSGYTTTSSIRMLSMDGTGTNRDCADLNLAIFR